MKTQAIITLLLLCALCGVRCKKQDDPCAYDKCDPRRKTIKVAENSKARVSVLSIRHPDVWVLVADGIIGYDGPIFDGPDIVVPCNMPDSLKIMDLKVTFSGDLKSSCDEYGPSLSTIYHSNLRMIKSRQQQ